MSAEIDREIDARLRNIAAARNLVNIPEETIAVLRAIGEMYIERERVAVEALIRERDGAPVVRMGDGATLGGVSADLRIAELKAFAKMLGIGGDPQQGGKTLAGDPGGA